LIFLAIPELVDWAVWQWLLEVPLSLLEHLIQVGNVNVEVLMDVVSLVAVDPVSDGLPSEVETTAQIPEAGQMLLDENR
jgi:hypothetical protein